MKSFILFFFLLLPATLLAETSADTSYPFTNASLANRFHALTQEIRCVVCQNQSIADSGAPLAHDLREKVYHLVLAQHSDTEIKQYLVERYGDFILLRPPFNKTTFLLWIFPFAALLLFAILIAYLYHGRPRQQ